MPYKIDSTSFSSQFGAFQVYETWKIPVAISGSIPDGFYNQYQASFAFDQDTARGRVSIQRPDTLLKTVFNAGVRLPTVLPGLTVYQYASSETVQTSTTYNASGTLFVNLYIFNQTGGSINLITQQLDILVEFYDAPVV